VGQPVGQRREHRHLPDVAPGDDQQRLGQDPRPDGTSTRGYRIRLMPGSYPGQRPFLDNRRGSRDFPIVIQSEAGGRTGRDATIIDGTIDIANSSFVYVLDLTVRPREYANDAIHLQNGDHLLLRGLAVSAFDPGGRRNSHDLVKVNQVSHMFVEDSDFAGAADNSLDFVAVRCGHIIANDIHEADDWCAYAKGGSAYLRVEGNRFFRCDGGGFTAGQGSGFQFTEPPLIHYEAYDVKVVNNVVHDVGKVAFGAQGAYNVLIAFNTAFRAGQGYDQFLSAERTCDPGEPTDRARCDSRRTMGGWGPTSASPSDYIVYIPNRHVFIYNNVLWNDQQPSDQHLRVPRPFANAPGFGAPTTVRSDDDLRLAGNVIANGGPGHPYATDGGCLEGHPTCGPSVSGPPPAAPSPAAARPRSPASPGRTLLPPGNLNNAVLRNFDGQHRTAPAHPGAF
jgi:Right handed beta helix region